MAPPDTTRFSMDSIFCVPLPIPLPPESEAAGGDGDGDGDAEAIDGAQVSKRWPAWSAAAFLARLSQGVVRCLPPAKSTCSVACGGADDGAPADESGEPPAAVCAAAAAGDDAAVREWLDSGGRVEAVVKWDGPSGATLLCVAARHGNERLVALLLERGALPNEGTADGTTPLMLAASGNHPSTVLRLCRAGASREMSRELQPEMVFSPPACARAAARCGDTPLASQAELGRRAGGGSGEAAGEGAGGGAGGWTALQMARRAGHEACVDAFKRHLEELQAARREEAAAEEATSRRWPGPSRTGPTTASPTVGSTATC